MVAEPRAADVAEGLVLASSAAMWERLQDRLAALRPGGGAGAPAAPTVPRNRGVHPHPCPTH